MTDKIPAPEKPYFDSKGREVFSIHPEILAGGAPYRKVDDAKSKETKSAAKDL
jgi:hypothetical protein